MSPPGLPGGNVFAVFVVNSFPDAVTQSLIAVYLSLSAASAGSSLVKRQSALKERRSRTGTSAATETREINANIRTKDDFNMRWQSSSVRRPALSIVRTHFDLRLFYVRSQV